MDIRRRLGLNVKLLRAKKGWSQEDLGFEAELHRTYISGIERGLRNPTISIVARLAAVLSVSPGCLLEGPDKPKKGRARRSA